MRKISQFIFLIIFFFNFANANIVEELTSLNNLYKEGAITKEEFYTHFKAIQNKDKEGNKKKIEIVKKKKIEKKEKVKDKTRELTQIMKI